MLYRLSETLIVGGAALRQVAIAFYALLTANYRSCLNGNARTPTTLLSLGVTCPQYFRDFSLPRITDSRDMPPKDCRDETFPCPEGKP